MICVMAVIEAVPPTFINFLKLNSNPKLNNNIMTPISAQTSTLWTSFTDGKKSKWFPAKKPAMRYPSTNGCLIILNSNTAIPGVIRINPKSLIKGFKCCDASATAATVLIYYS